MPNAPNTFPAQCKGPTEQICLLWQILLCQIWFKCVHTVFVFTPCLPDRLVRKWMWFLGRASAIVLSPCREQLPKLTFDAVKFPQQMDRTTWRSNKTLMGTLACLLPKRTWQELMAQRERTFGRNVCEFMRGGKFPVSAIRWNAVAIGDFEDLLFITYSACDELLSLMITRCFGDSGVRLTRVQTWLWQCLTPTTPVCSFDGTASASSVVLLTKHFLFVAGEDRCGRNPICLLKVIFPAFNW